MIHFHQRLAARLSTAATTCRRVRAWSCGTPSSTSRVRKRWTCIQVGSSVLRLVHFALSFVGFWSESRLALRWLVRRHLIRSSPGYNTVEQHGTDIFITRTPSAVFLLYLSISETCACCLQCGETSAMIRYCVLSPIFAECPHVQPAGRVDPRARRRRRLFIFIQIQKQGKKYVRKKKTKLAFLS